MNEGCNLFKTVNIDDVIVRAKIIKKATRHENYLKKYSSYIACC